jgi:hypothetical protein
MPRRLLLLLLGMVAIGTASADGWHSPQRDAGGLATATATGAAIVTGVVVSADPTPQPLRRAIVTVSSAGQLVGSSAITDDEGRFTIGNVAAGRVTITAVKRGYVSGAYGATRPGRPGTPLAIAAGQTAAVSIVLARAAVITGIVRDERNEPLPGLRVFAIDAHRPVAPPPNSGETGVLTDDRGIYRLYDLTPGDYLVAATPTDAVIGEIVRRSDAETNAVLARLQARAGRPNVAAPAPAASVTAETLAPIYYPGTAVLGDAAPLSLAAGDVRQGVDFVMRAVPVTTIEGVVISSEGALPASVEMSISPGATLRFFALASANPQLVQRPGADGRFKYTTIAPGRYTIAARAGGSAAAESSGRGAGRGVTMVSGSSQVFAGRGTASPDTLYAIEEVEVSGFPVSGVTLQLRRGSRLTGRVVFDASTQPPPADLTTVRVTVQPVDTSGSTVAGTTIGSSYAATQNATVGTDGTFEIPSLGPGSYRASVTVPAEQSWWFRSAVIDGRDVLDASLDVTLGSDVSGAVLTMTDRRSQLSGTLTTAAGLPAPEYFVIVMPTDPALRTAGSRRVKSTRPATDGTFAFAELPAGDYLLVALTDVDPNEWQTPAFLATIAPGGVPVRIVEGEKKVQDIRLGGG